MSLIVSIFINFTRISCGNSTRNYYNAAALLKPPDELIAVITFVRYDKFATQIKVFQKRLSQANIITVAAGENEFEGIAQTVYYSVYFCS